VDDKADVKANEKSQDKEDALVLDKKVEEEKKDPDDEKVLDKKESKLVKTNLTVDLLKRIGSIITC
jgi:hypothetical protein